MSESSREEGRWQPSSLNMDPVLKHKPKGSKHPTCEVPGRKSNGFWTQKTDRLDAWRPGRGRASGMRSPSVSPAGHSWETSDLCQASPPLIAGRQNWASEHHEPSRPFVAPDGNLPKELSRVPQQREEPKA